MHVRHTLVSLTAALFVLSNASALAAKTPRTQVMVLGVAHLVAKHDVHNSVFADSPLSPKRQTQIQDIVARLARFHPTKVLIEEPMGDAAFTERYRRYLAGTFTLGANEVCQFGFRLAAVRVIAPSILSIRSDLRTSTRTRSSGKRIFAYLPKNFEKARDPVFDAYLAREEALERTGTYLDLLRYLNSDAAIRANAGWYSVMTAWAGRRTTPVQRTCRNGTRATAIFSRTFSAWFSPAIASW